MVTLVKVREEHDKAEKERKAKAAKRVRYKENTRRRRIQALAEQELASTTSANVASAGSDSSWTHVDPAAKERAKTKKKKEGCPSPAGEEPWQTDSETDEAEWLDQTLAEVRVQESQPQEPHIALRDSVAQVSGWRAKVRRMYDDAEQRLEMAREVYKLGWEQYREPTFEATINTYWRKFLPLRERVLNDEDIGYLLTPEDKEMFPRAALKEMFNMAEGMKVLLKEQHQSWDKWPQCEKEAPRQGWYRSGTKSRFMEACRKLHEITTGNLRTVQFLRGVILSPTLRDSTDPFVKEQFANMEQFLLRQFHDCLDLQEGRPRRSAMRFYCPGPPPICKQIGCRSVCDEDNPRSCSQCKGPLCDKCLPQRRHLCFQCWVFTWHHNPEDYIDIYHLDVSQLAEQMPAAWEMFQVRSWKQYDES